MLILTLVAGEGIKQEESCVDIVFVQAEPRLFPFICGQDRHVFVPFDALAIIGTISQRRVAMEVAGLAIMDEAQRRT